MLREAILDNVVSTLKTITRDNGYNNDMVTVKRTPVNESVLQMKDYPAASVVWKREEKDIQGSPQDYVQNDLTLTVRCVIRATEDIEGELNRMIDDVEKALTSSPTRGGYAELTDPLLITIFQGESDKVLYFDYDFHVRYFYVWGNP
jgi:hypothetical protein